jgi:hypothetical protein
VPTGSRWSRRRPSRPGSGRARSGRRTSPARRRRPGREVRPGRLDPRGRRLPLVRGLELGPAGGGVPSQPALLARWRLPRHRLRGARPHRRAALVERPNPRAVPRRDRRRRGPGRRRGDPRARRPGRGDVLARAAHAGGRPARRIRGSTRVRSRPAGGGSGRGRAPGPRARHRRPHARWPAHGQRPHGPAPQRRGGSSLDRRWHSVGLSAKSTRRGSPSGPAVTPPR